MILNLDKLKPLVGQQETSIHMILNLAELKPLVGQQETSIHMILSLDKLKPNWWVNKKQAYT